jgi:hypothetical protein
MQGHSFVISSRRNCGTHRRNHGRSHVFALLMRRNVAFRPSTIMQLLPEQVSLMSLLDRERMLPMIALGFR